MRRAAVLLGSVIALGAASPAYGANGLVASWPFDEGSGTVVHDTSGHGSNGVLSGVAHWVSGFAGSGLSFDGSSGRMRVPESASLDPSSSVTVSAWTRATEPQGSYNYIIAKGARGCRAASYGLYTGPNGGLMFYVASDRGFSYTRSPDGGTAVWNGQWHFVVGTYDGSSVRLYLDGRQVGGGVPHTGPIDYNFPDNDLFIGHYSTCPGLDFRGSVDSAQIYNRALTSPEIRDTYNQLTGANLGGSPGGTSQGGTSSGAVDGGSSGSAGRNPQSSPRPGASNNSDVTVASVSGLSSGKPHFVLRVAGRAGTHPIKSFTVSLPPGLHFVHSVAQLRRGVSLAHRPRSSLSLRQGQLMVVFTQPQRSVALTISRHAVVEDSSLIKRVQAIVKFNRAKPSAKKTVLVLWLGVRLTDATAKTAVVHAVLRVS